MIHTKFFSLCAILPNIFTAIAANRPRGVGPDFAKFYQSETEFNCILNPSITIKPSRINDDYCDCPDGSDEPGTAACSSVSPLSPQQLPSFKSYNTTLAIPGFYCKNRDHIPSYIPFMRVNDGICDYELCCDGSDEWAEIGGIKCIDQCSEIGKEWKRQQESKENYFRIALKKRAQLVSEAKILRSQLETKTQNLQQEIADLEKTVMSLKTNYEDIKKRERGRMLKSSNREKAGKVAVLAGLVKIRINDLRQALSQEVSKNTALQERVDSLENILSTFKQDYNPNFNDEGVKRAVKAWEEYSVKHEKNNDKTEESDDFDVDEILKEDNEENGIKWSEWENGRNGENDENAVIYKFEKYLPEPVRTWFDTKLINLRIFLMDNGFLPSVEMDETENHAVSEAREAHVSKLNELNAKKTTKEQCQVDLARDYGKDEVFRALEGKCLEKDSGEYIYEICWLKETKQKSKKNGVEIKMGAFTSFGKLKIDEDRIRGFGNNQVTLGSISALDSTVEQLTLRYENGQDCWNGPSRETLVLLSCAEEDVILKINEFEKCKYRMEVGTPAVCDIFSKSR